MTPRGRRFVALIGLAAVAACGRPPVDVVAVPGGASVGRAAGRAAVGAPAPVGRPTADPATAAATALADPTVRAVASTAAPPTTAVPAPAVTAPPRSTTAPPTTAAPAPPVPVIGSHDAHLDTLGPRAGPVPVAVQAGAASFIDGPVVATGVDPTTSELAVPADASVVAWYQFGPAPGQAGSAVLAGHVDWHGVPGIFFKLRQLASGDPVSVTMSDGSVLAFHVVDTRMVDKPELPQTGVFARTGDPTLTLVTCGGQFDSSTHHYLSNVVVTALPD
jgi:LPXTG-site transpeptidase (sortase) family protein